MLGGFDPRLRELFLRRRQGRAIVWAVALLIAMSITAWIVSPEGKEESVEVELAPEIKDFAVEEEPEPEIEEEPPPPPPPNTKIKVVNKPKKRKKIKPPDKKVTEAAEESDQDKAFEVGPGGPGSPGGMGNRPKTDNKPPPPKPKPKPEPPPKPKPKKKKKAAPIDPTKPIDRPENATAPKPKPDNKSPVYPKELREKGITGMVVIKLHVHRDGSVRGAKILRKKNNATTDADKDRANKLFLAAVIRAVKTWSFTPAKLNGQPITVWHTVTVPFKLQTAD